MRRRVVFTEKEKVVLNNHASFVREFKVLKYSKKELTILSKKIDDYIEEERFFREPISVLDEMWIFEYINIKEFIEKEIDRREKGGFLLGVPGSGRGYIYKCCPLYISKEKSFRQITDRSYLLGI